MTTTRIASNPSVPAVFGDPIMDAQAAMLDGEYAQQDSAAVARRAAREQRDAAQQEQVRRIRESAVARLASGIVGSAGQMTQGACGMVQGGHQLARNEGAATQWGAASSIARGAADCAVAGINYHASMLDASAQESAHTVQRANDAAEDARAAEDRGRQRTERSLQKIDEARQAHAQLVSLILGNIRA